MCKKSTDAGGEGFSEKEEADTVATPTFDGYCENGHRLRPSGGCGVAGCPFSSPPQSKD